MFGAVNPPKWILPNRWFYWILAHFWIRRRSDTAVKMIVWKLAKNVQTVSSDDLTHFLVILSTISLSSDPIDSPAFLAFLVLSSRFFLPSS